jgi:hypothetical protein
MTESREVHSRNYDSLPAPVDVTDIESLRFADPGMYEAYEAILAGLRQDLLPSDASMALLEAMNPAIQRELVSRIAGLESSVLMTIKSQLVLVDAVLRRVVNPDGSPVSTRDDTGITPKEAINLSIKITQMLTRDIPKLYTADRYQRAEATLFGIVERMLTKEQQDAFLRELHEQTLKDAKQGDRG